jgi:peptidoglycan/LPS O-acetylase OafA/YrhL
MLVNIQFLRFAAAMLVVLYHTAARVPESDNPLYFFFQAGSAIGFAGVDVFFVISGFIMAYTTLDRGGAADGSQFARRRAARIYSGYWPFFLLALVVFTWARAGHVADSNLLKSFWLWPQPLNLNLLEVTWTLSFELYFYLLFTMLVWLARPSIRVFLCWAILAVIVTFNAWRHFVIGGFGPDHLYSIPFYDQFLTSPFIAQFFAGAVLAYYLQSRPRGAAWRWLLAGILLFLASGVINERVFDGLIEQGYHVLPRTTLFGIASLMMVIGLVRLEGAGRIAPKRFSLLTGGASYAIYLSHVPIIVLVHHLGMGAWAQGQSFVLTTLVYCLLMAAILGLSVVHYRLIEKPLSHWFRRWLGV